jgi:hypothetical protein
MVEQQQSVPETKETIEKEEYKDLGEYLTKVEPVEVEKKPQPAGSYGHRVRVAKIYESYDELMYKIVSVAGWARTVRPGGKDFCFIEINDGSSLKGIQVSYCASESSPCSSYSGKKI